MDGLSVLIMLQDVWIVMGVIEEDVILLDAVRMCAIGIVGVWPKHGNYMVKLPLDLDHGFAGNSKNE